MGLLVMLNRKSMHLIMLAILLFSNCCLAKATTALTLKERINNFLKENEDLTSRLSIAIQVKDLNSEQEIYSLNPYKRMTPASVTKSFTAYAALKYLGPDYNYTTKILAQANKIDKKGNLNDNLYIKFSGDPSLTLKDFSNLIAKLKERNIKNINGKIIIDDFVFDQQYQAEGWPWDDSKFCFAAPTSAITVGGNCFRKILSPAKKIGETAKLSFKTKVPAKIYNNIVTKRDPGCIQDLVVESNNIYHLNGCIDINSPEIRLNIAYQDPRLMIKYYVKDLLIKHNIKFNNKISFNKMPSSYKSIAEHKSKNLPDLVNYMHKMSNNIYADNFAKTIGANYYKTKGSFANAKDAIERIISLDTGIDFSQMKIRDGSGGSRYNLIAPDHLVDLFIEASKNPNIGSYFYKSLPISAVDGTMTDRFAKYPKLHNKIHAKTGAMNGVATLSGYLDPDNGKTMVFAIMINGHIGSKSQINNFIEEFLNILSSN